jgi:hypothetical protein
MAVVHGAHVMYTTTTYKVQNRKTGWRGQGEGDKGGERLIYIMMHPSGGLTVQESPL